MFGPKASRGWAANSEWKRRNRGRVSSRTRTATAPFVTALVSGELIDVLGEDEHAATVYVVEAPLAKDYRGMEYLTVADGRISHVISVFDLSPGLKAKAAAEHG